MGRRSSARSIHRPVSPSSSAWRLDGDRARTAAEPPGARLGGELLLGFRPGVSRRVRRSACRAVGSSADGPKPSPFIVALRRDRRPAATAAFGRTLTWVAQPNYIRHIAAQALKRSGTVERQFVYEDHGAGGWTFRRRHRRRRPPRTVGVTTTGSGREHLVNPGETGPAARPAPNCTSRGLVLDKSCNNLDDGNGYVDDARHRRDRQRPDGRAFGRHADGWHFGRCRQQRHRCGGRELEAQILP